MDVPQTVLTRRQKQPRLRSIQGMLCSTSLPIWLVPQGSHLKPLSWDMTFTVNAIAEAALQNASCSMLVHTTSLDNPWATDTSRPHPKSLLRVGTALQHAVQQQPLSETLPVICYPRMGGQVTQVLQCPPVPPLLPCPVQTHGLAPAQHLQQGKLPSHTQSLLSWVLAGRAAWAWPSVGSMPHRAERCCVEMAGSAPEAQQLKLSQPGGQPGPNH